jgi:hypothetical protein
MMSVKAGDAGSQPTRGESWATPHPFLFTTAEQRDSDAQRFARDCVAVL